MRICDKFSKGEMESIVEFTLDFVNNQNLIEDSLSISIYELELRKSESYFLVVSEFMSECLPNEYFLCETLDEATRLVLHAMGEFTCIYQAGWTATISVDNDEFMSELLELQDLVEGLGGCEVSLDVEKNPFKGCYLYDTTLTDEDEIYEFIVELNSIYINLPDEEKQKPIYLNFEYGNKCIFASHKKSYLAFSEPINNLLGYKWDDAYEVLYDQNEEEETCNALSPSVDYLTETRKISILDIDLPF